MRPILIRFLRKPHKSHIHTRFFSWRTVSVTKHEGVDGREVMCVCVPNAVASAMAASADVRRMIQQVFLTQLRAHSLTFSIANAMHRDGDPPLTVIACWWMAFKFEELGSDLTVHDLVDLFPALVDSVGRAEALRKTEISVLARLNFCLPHRTRLRQIYDRLPRETAAAYHEWLIVLEEYRLVYLFPPAHWVDILTGLIERNLVAPTLQLIALTILRRRHRKRLCPIVPRIGHRVATAAMRARPFAK